MAELYRYRGHSMVRTLQKVDRSKRRSAENVATRQGTRLKQVRKRLLEKDWARRRIEEIDKGSPSIVAESAEFAQSQSGNRNAV